MIWTRRALKSTFIALALVPAVGCGPAVSVRLENATNFQRMKAGRTAVFKVAAVSGKSSVGGFAAWGIVRNPTQAESFARHLAVAARQFGKLDVVSPGHSDGRKRNGPPDVSPEKMGALAAELGCTSYLTARINNWSSTYLLLYQRTRLDFVLEGVVMGEEPLTWRAHVRYARSWTDDQTAVLQALEYTFKRLNRAAARYAAPGHVAGPVRTN